jgi:uncharacterized membrane protein YvlD (DUF360 family)
VRFASFGTAFLVAVVMALVNWVLGLIF